MASKELEILRRLDKARAEGNKKEELQALKDLDALQKPSPETAQEDAQAEPSVSAVDAAQFYAGSGLPGIPSLISGADTLLSLARNIGGMSAGGLAGAAVTPIEGAEKGAELSQKIQSQVGAPPYTPSGRQSLEAIGEAAELLNVPASGVAGMTQLYKGIDPAVEAIESVQEKGAGQAIGDALFEEYDSPLLATLGVVLPDAIASIVPARAGQVAVSNARKRVIREIKENPANPEFVDKIVTESGDLAVNPFVRPAIRQGISKDAAAIIKAASDADKKAMLDMLGIRQRIDKNPEAKIFRRPNAVVGDSLAARVDHVYKINQDAAKDIGRIAGDFKGQTIDGAAVYDSFLANLTDNGVKISRKDDGAIKLDFRGSTLEDLGADRLFTKVANRLDGSTDAFELHQLKQWIDSQVSYAQAPLKGKGLGSKAEALVKGVRRDISERLKGLSDEYKKANETYAQTLEPLENLQRITGRTDILGESSSRALGQTLRGLLSNNKTQPELLDSILEIDRIASQTGGAFKDNIPALILFSDELDRVFGTPATTSFEGGIEKAVSRATTPGVTDVATWPLREGWEKARSAFFNREQQYRALEDLIKSK